MRRAIAWLAGISIAALVTACGTAPTSQPLPAVSRSSTSSVAASTTPAGSMPGSTTASVSDAPAQSTLVLTGISFWNARDGLLTAVRGTTGMIEATKDGGVSWTTVDRVDQVQCMGAPTVVGTQDAWVGIRTCSSTGGASLLHTTNGGQDWTAEVQQSLGSVTFVHAQTGWAIRSSPPSTAQEVVTTSDAGKTWRAVSEPPCPKGEPPTAVAAASTTKLYVLCAGQPGVGMQSKTLEVNKGSTWQVIASSTEHGPPELPQGGYASGIAFPSTANGYAWFARGGLMVTKDGGQTWKSVVLGSGPYGSDQPRSLSFVSTAVGYVLAQNELQQKVSLLTTADGGSTWSTVTTWKHAQ